MSVTELPPRALGGKRERTRAALIEAAVEIIAERGFDLTSLEEVARRAGMSRGAIYGNFPSREALFMAVIGAAWSPVQPTFVPGAPFAVQMRAFGEAVAVEARRRRPRAAAMASFQLYLFTHEPMRRRMSEQNAEAYRQFAAALEDLVPEDDLPMPSGRLARVLDALTTGLMFTYFQTPELISDEDIIAAFTALAGPLEDQALPATPSAWALRAR